MWTEWNKSQHSLSDKSYLFPSVLAGIARKGHIDTELHKRERERETCCQELRFLLKIAENMKELKLEFELEGCGLQILHFQTEEELCNFI
ncbi:Hypothetical predicted protein [Podarcis lilfordi]|uniref:Uncharacterized protein n=1 Tax=Podarcis lilfordi TaxID=74358 RepID=A0AA35JXU6_9SAUR|nr:Hypothetical predicted protein [Podarcis lilfordi]